MSHEGYDEDSQMAELEAELLRTLAESNPNSNSNKDRESQDVLQEDDSVIITSTTSSLSRSPPFNRPQSSSHPHREPLPLHRSSSTRGESSQTHRSSEPERRIPNPPAASPSPPSSPQQNEGSRKRPSGAEIQEFVRSQKKKFKTEMIISPNNPADYDGSILVLNNVTGNFGPEDLHKKVNSFMGNVNVLEKVEKAGSVWNLYFIDEEHALEFRRNKFMYGTVVSQGRAITSFFRITYTSKDLRPGQEERIVDSVKDAIGVVLVSVTINAEKNCVSIYLGCISDLTILLRSSKAKCIKIKNAGPLCPSFYIHAKRSTVTSSHPDLVKVQLSGVSNKFTDETLLAGLQRTLCDIVPEECLLGVGIYVYPDTGKQASFAFLMVEGVENAELLDSIEVPTPYGQAIQFQKAVEKKTGDKDFKDSGNRIA